jgi:hypothetical protein
MEGVLRLNFLFVSVATRDGSMGLVISVELYDQSSEMS